MDGYDPLQRHVFTFEKFIESVKDKLQYAPAKHLTGFGWSFLANLELLFKCVIASL